MGNGIFLQPTGTVGPVHAMIPRMQAPAFTVRTFFLPGY